MELQTQVTALQAQVRELQAQTRRNASVSVANTNGSMYFVEEHGIWPNGNDVSTALNTLISTVNAAGGGTIIFSAGTYVLLGNIVFPSSGQGVPRQSPIRIVGAGHHEDGRWGNSAPHQGTILKFSGTNGLAHIDTRGTGALVLQDLTFQVGSNTELPIIHTTNTTLKISCCCFWGYYPNQNANNDAIVLGGTTTNTDGSSTAAFQGYGTTIENNFFQNVRRVVYGRVYANGVVVRDNTIGSSCGTNLSGGACIELDGNACNAVSGQFCTGWTIIGNTIEATRYVYPIKLTAASWNVIIGNGTYDDTTITQASVYISDFDSFGNVIIGSQPLSYSKPYLVDNSGQPSNYFLSPVIGGIAGAYSNVGATKLHASSPEFPNLINNVRFTAGTGGTIIQPTASLGSVYSAKVFQIIRSDADTRLPGTEVFACDISGGIHLNDINAGNITNSVPTGASWTANGRTWACNGIGGMMTQNSGSGGSYFYMRNYAAIFTRWDNNNQVAKVGPIYGGNGLEGIGFGTAADAGIYRGANGQTITISPLQTPSFTVATLPAPTAALKGARAHVTDAKTPAYLSPVAAGGAVVCPVFCNGTEWVCA